MNKRRTKKACTKLREGRPLTEHERLAVKALTDAAEAITSDVIAWSQDFLRVADRASAMIRAWADDVLRAIERARRQREPGKRG